MHPQSLNTPWLRFSVVAALLWLRSGQCLAADALPSQADVLSRMHQALDRYSSLDLNASVDVNYRVDGQNSTETSTVLVRREGLKALISTKTCFHESAKGTPNCRQFDQIVYDNNDVLLCDAGLTPSLSQVDGEGNIKVSLLSTRIAGQQDIDRESMWNGLNDGAAVVWIVGYRPLLDYLDQASQVDFRQSDSIAEVSVTSAYGEATLELDGTAGWMPKSIQIIKRPNHLIMGKPLSEATEGKADDITFVLKATNYVLDAEGNWRPGEITVERTTHWKNKNIDTTKTRIEIHSVKFDPVLEDSAFESSIKIPVGYQIGVVGAGHLPYIWNGHEPVPGIPEKSNLRALDSSAASRSGRLQLLIVFNGVLIVILLVVMWRRKESPLK